MPLVDPTTGEQYGTAPVSNEEDIDDAYAAAATRVFGLEAHHPVAPAEGAAGLRRRGGEGSAASSSRRRAATPVSHDHVTMAEEIPPMVDQIRFFAGAARILEGKSAGEYMEGHTSWIRREPVGVDRPGHAVELPDDDGDLEVRARDRGGQHRRHQAQRHHAGDHRDAGRARVQAPAAGCAQRRHRRPGDRGRAGGASDAADGVDHRFGGGRPRGRRRRQAGISSARISSSAERRR